MKNIVDKMLTRLLLVKRSDAGIAPAIEVFASWMCGGECC